MKAATGCLIGLIFGVSVSANPLLEGHVRLPSGAPVPGAQVLLFDLSDLRAAPAAATADRSGRFTLPLAGLAGALPQGFELGANYPNPFNPSTMIPYQLRSSMHVRLEVFNLLGQRIATLMDGEQPAGFHTASWDATDAAGQAVGAGVYIYRLVSGGQAASRRMLLIDGQAGISSGGGGSTLLEGEAGAGEDGEKAPAYGLTVSGPGLVPYVDPAFRVEAGMAPLEVAIEAPGSLPTAKAASSGGILGDVDNTGRVDFSDAMLVALYSHVFSIILPNNGDIFLGDVDADGRVDLTDASLIVAWLYNPSAPGLPAGIGEPVGPAAALSPDPSTVSLADDAVWHRFTVEAGEPVTVVANPGAESPRLEITTRSGRGNSCPAEADDDVSREDGEAIYLAGCAAGAATVELRREADGTVLNAYAFEVTGSPADLVVASVSVSDSSLTTGESFALSATVRNQGTGPAAATTLRWYRSPDASISPEDTQVGTDQVDALAASGTGAESIRLTAPTSEGTWYYGACVAGVSGESAGNNCSRGVSVTVTSASSSRAWKMYWMDEYTSKIQRSNLDGSRVEDLVTTGLGVPTGIALDVAGGKIYWTDSGADKIQRSNLDGSDIEDLVTTGLVTPAGIALDVAGGKIYWADRGTDKIHRSNLDGSDIEDLVTTGLKSPTGIALDVAGGKIYWADRGTDKIQRSNLDGSDIEDLVTTGLDFPSGIALDVAEGRIYWADRGTDKIRRSNLDGSDIEDLVTTGLDFPSGIALDVAGGKIYWTDSGTDKIQRSNLDGSRVEDLVTTGLATPQGIAVDVAGGKIYWTDSGTDKIQRSNLDGTGVEDPVATGFRSRIALDVAGGKMYWTDYETDKIRRSNLDGSDIEDLVTTGLDGPDGIALDVSESKIYWADWGTDKIRRSNLDGSDIEDLVTTGLKSPSGIALDVAGGKMYWTDFGTDKIQRANLDGSRVEDLVTNGLDGPDGIALDVAGGKIYWMDWGTGKIQRANLDGSRVEDLVTTGLEFPWGIALDVSGGKIYWTDADTEKIQRANLDGSRVEDLVTTGLGFPTGIAVGLVPVVGTAGAKAAAMSPAHLRPHRHVPGGGLLGAEEEENQGHDGDRCIACAGVKERSNASPSQSVDEP